MISIGIQKNHDSSVCIYEDEKLIYYNQEERVVKEKHASSMPISCIKKIPYITSKEINNSYLTGYGYNKNEAQWTSDLLKLLHINQAPDIKWYGLPYGHHIAHAYKAFNDSGFDDALVVVSDGRGSSYGKEEAIYETTTVFYMVKNKNPVILYKKLHSENINLYNRDSLKFDFLYDISNKLYAGHLYIKATINLGFGEEDCGKLMGLSAYGKANEKYKDKIYTIEELKEIKVPEEDRADFAYAIQNTFEQHYINNIDIGRVLKPECKNIVLTGGAALNVVANYKVKKLLNKDNYNLFVEPMCGDDGNSIGIAQYYLQNQYGYNFPKLESLYIVGEYPDYSNIKLNEGENITDITPEQVVGLLEQGNIVCLYQGKAEAGPRALGNRSILFDPRIPNGKDIVNKIKKRESFRPFACTIMHEHVNEYFDMAGLEESPFMMYAVQALEGVDKIIPSVIHKDNTCRVQTLKEYQNKHYYELIKTFKEKTNIPILFNTSFNLAGETIVDTVEDAIDTLRRSELQYLYLPEIKKLITVL